MKRKKLRPAGWYKSGATILKVWGIGTILVTAIALGFLYPNQLKLEAYRNKIVEANAYQKNHQSILAENAKKPIAPGPSELTALQESVPTEADSARLLVEVTEAVTSAGASMVELRAADTLSKVPPLDEQGKVQKEATIASQPETRQEVTVLEQDEEKKEEKEEKKEKKEGPEGKEREENLESGVKKSQPPLEEEPPPASKDPAVKRYWMDLYVQADDNEFSSLLQALSTMKRTLHIYGWEYIDKRLTTGNIRIRFAFFSYEEPKLAGKMPEPASLQGVDLPSPPSLDEKDTEKEKNKEDEAKKKEKEEDATPPD